MRCAACMAGFGGWVRRGVLFIEVYEGHRDPRGGFLLIVPHHSPTLVTLRRSF